MKLTDHLFITLAVIFNIIESHSKNNFLHIYGVEQKSPPWFF